MGSIFGGSKQKSSSANQAFGQIRDTFTPVTGMAGTGADAMKALLSGDASGFNAFKAATGFDAAAEQGSRGVTGNAAARGLLRSGSTGKALQTFGQNLQNQYSSNYLDQLAKLAGIGLNAGGLIANAGQTSTSKGKSKPGIGGFLGSVASGVAASDRRLKKNIIKLRELPDGLGVYSYKYINNTGPYVGVMADEVKELRPKALGPIIDGYATVDYSKIGEL